MNKQVVSLIILSLIFSPFLISASVSLTPPIAARNFCELFTSISNVIAGLIGALGTIMIVVAGIFYLTSAGNPGKMETAKKTFLYAIIGIAIGISAGTIVAIIKEMIEAGGGTC